MPDVVKLPGVSIDIDADDYIFYASATSTTPAVRGISIVADPGVTYENLVAHIWVTSLGKQLTQPFPLTLGRLHSDEPTLAQTRLQWNVAALWDIIETQPAEIIVELRNGDDVVHREVKAIEVASPQDWLFFDRARTKDLAAYVQPNHPALVQVLNKAADLLGERGKKSSFSGYQDMDHIPDMVEALWDAMKTFKISYSNPPASWATRGQKVRTPAQVIEDRLGTCLDTSVTFAALLENVGLWPVIAVTHGHAWVGYWSYDADNEQRLNNQSVSKISELINNADIAPPKLVLLESTLICEYPQYRSYGEAVQMGLENVKSSYTLGAYEQVSEIIDIRAARGFAYDGIKPMPARVFRTDGTVEVIEYRPAEFSYNIFLDKVSEAAQSRGRAANVLDLQVPPRLKVWLDSLLDLSLRNPLINFRNPASSLQIAMADGIIASLEDMLNLGESFEFIADDRARDHIGTRGESQNHSKEQIAKMLKEHLLLARFSSGESAKRLRKMHSQAKAIFEETNSNELHLALGELVWKPKGKGEVRSPLILVPVNLNPKNRGQNYALTIDERSQVTPNYSLLQLFQRETRVDLSMLAELETDNSGINVDKVLNQVREKIAEAGLTGVRVDESAHIGFFNFSAYRLWRDLVDNWQTFEKNPLVKHLIYSPNLAFEDPAGGELQHDLDSLLARLPIEADSSQAFAVAEALAGKTFILQGPPGTGKSQTITNLLARSLESGKRVLFVAEKKEALDVVKDRLVQVGLGDFSLDLHDKAMSPKLVKQQLLTAVNKVVDVDQVGFDSQLNAYGQSVRPMINYRDRLHEVSDLGESIYSAADKYLAVTGEAELPISGEFVANATKEQRDQVLETFKTMSNSGSALPTTKTNEWFITSLTEQTNETLNTLKSNLERISGLWDKLRADQLVLDYLKSVETRQEFGLSKVLNFTDVAGLEPGKALGAEARNQRAKAVTALNHLGTKLLQAPFDLRNLSLINPDQEILALAEANSSNFILKGSKLSKIQKRLNSILGAEVVKDPAQLPGLLTLFRELTDAEMKATPEVAAVVGLNYDSSQNLLNAEVFNTVQSQLQKLEALATFSEVHRAGNLSSADVANAALANPSRFESLISLIDQINELFATVEMTDEASAIWLRGEPFGKRLADSLEFWLGDHKQHGLMQFGRVVQLNQMFKTIRQAKLDNAVEEIVAGRVGYEDAASAFTKGYYRAVLETLLVRIGFNTFDSTANNNFLIRLREAKHNLQKIMPNILAGELAKRKGFDPNLNRGAAGDLRLAITSKKLTPIRTLLQKHWDVISKVSPCVLASPDSTVRFIDANLPPFDLVVFDEASQIRVANSIGAMGRGKATIVVGDSKQMPPTSVAQVKADGTIEEADDDGTEVSNDAESILDLCSNAKIPDVYLNWHYRSEDETLIAFSNNYYYESRLNTFPNPNPDRTEKGLSFRHVTNGQFKRRGDKLPGEVGVNENEAQAIVAEIARRANDPELRKDSLGVVTFNQQQQRRIEELLWESKDPGIQNGLEQGFGGEPILIKNLETVQGSERDVILFSIAFSKTPGGKELPLNFGPMNQDGGSRRLNVAITRARKQVMVFCSFLPKELKARNSDKQGIRDLADFLAIANNENSTQGLNVTTELDLDNRVRSSIVEALKKSGLNAKEGIGLSGFKVDIAVYDDANPRTAILGILLDGRRWNSRATVNDRDLLPLAVLTNKMGWPMVERIWLPAWLRDQAGEVERIKEAFEKAKVEAKNPRVKPEPKALQTEEAEVIEDIQTNEEDPFLEFSKKLPQLVLTTVKRAGHPSDLEYLSEQAVKEVLRNLAITITNVEGPVSPDRLVEFIASSFGKERVSSKLRQEILDVGYPSHKTDAEGFYYPINADPETHKAFQVGSARHIDNISKIELANIMTNLATLGQGYREESLIKDTSTLLGIKALSTQARTRLSAAVDLGLETNRLRMDGEYIKSS